MRRTGIALGLTLAAVAIPAGAWYVRGSADVERTIERIEKEPEALARLSAQRLARRIGARLEALRKSESSRPYYQYQALMHDPRGVSEGIALTPSPLAEETEDPLVGLWFQIDPQGRVSSPLFVESAPAGSAPGSGISRRRAAAGASSAAAGATSALAGVGDGPSADARAVSPDDDPPRARARRSLEALRGSTAAIARLTATAPAAGERAAGLGDTSVDSGRVAARNPEESVPTARSPDDAGPLSPSPEIPDQRTQLGATVQQLDASAFYQNSMNVQLAQDLKAPSSVSAQVRLEEGRRSTGKTVSVSVGPMAWTQLDIDGGPALVAVRRVVTPAGAMTQGFQIARERIESSYSGATLPSRLVPGPPSGPTEARLPLEGAVWHVAVDPAPLYPIIGERGDALRRRFMSGFLTATSLALLMGMLVVLQVRRAEQTAAERSRFAASAAHELRTPLASVRLYAEMLADGLGDPERGREYARTIADEAERLGRVVSNVLGFSRLERGALTVRPSPGDLGEAVRRTLERLSPVLEAKGAVISSTIAPSLPAVAFDADALEQILRNLLDNAEKFALRAPDRTIHVSVAALEGNQGVALGVRDHGPGIASTHRRALFRPFARGKDKDAPSGLGLGLAMVRALATAHGGEATYEPAEGGGALFQVRFPALNT